MKNEKNLETIVVISTALVIFGLIYNIKIFYLSSVIIGFIGVFIKPLSFLINKIWYNLSKIMGFIMSKVILTIIFFILLFPIALLYKIFTNNPLQLINKQDNMWINREHEYTKSDLENIW